MTQLASTRQPWYRRFRTGPASVDQPIPCVHDAVLNVLRRQPQRTLLVDEVRNLGNGALVEAVDRRARLLLERCGGPDQTVAVRLGNDVELAVTYFACLRAGLRYLPLPAVPPRVTTDLLRAIAPRLLVTRAGRKPEATDVETLVLDESAEASADVRLPAADPQRVAHVLLTSGTGSGSPRAVVTDHRGSILSHRWRTILWPYDPARDVVGCNIFGIWDLVPALLQGVPVVMLEDTTLRDPLALASAVMRYGITRLMLTPTLLDACLESAEAVIGLGRLRLIVLCGEIVTPGLVERVRQRLPAVQVANLYSLSECHDVAAGTLQPGLPITAGQVAPFADVHVVRPDDPRRLAAVGEAGRLLVGGRGLARGYLDPDETARRFFSVASDDPEVSGDAPSLPVYDSGDLGRLNADGTLEILGRADSHLKIRGAWADPETVTALLLQQPWVARAVALAEQHDDGPATLAAFLVPDDGAPPDLPEQLRAALSASLPPQSVPSRIELLDDLPLLPSGKIDPGRLLRGRDGGRRHPPPNATPPITPGPLEHSLLTAFRQVLQQPKLGPTDAFDASGGDSLTAIVLCSRIHAFTGHRVRVRDLQRHSSPTELARFLAERPSARVPERFPLPMDRLPAAAPRPRRVPRTVLLTGATGTLGQPLLRRILEHSDLQVVALVRGEGDGHARTRLTSALPDPTPLRNLTVLAGDLTQPRLGLGDASFAELVHRVDAVLHLAARVDMFAGYESLAAVNVAGTRHVLELAIAGGATFYHLSSSAVLPLGSKEAWDESRHGRSLLEALAPRLVYSDGYSQAKLAAEALVWQAAERGLPVRVVRVPHLIGPGHASRLADTLAVLVRLGRLPEGPWRWQVARVELVCQRLLHDLLAVPRDTALVHLAAPPARDTEIEAALQRRGHRLPRMSLPALANLITEAARQPEPEWTRRQAANIAALAQLIGEHGVRPALCLDEALLVSDRPLPADPARLLVDSLPD